MTKPMSFDDVPIFMYPGSRAVEIAPGDEKCDVVKTCRFGHFWQFSWAIAQSFWLWGRFQWLDTLGTQKLGRR